MCYQCLYSCTSASFHVENAVKDLQTFEVEEPEAEYQEQPESEYEVADQASDQDFTNTDTQQGKPRCILTRVLTSV